MSSMSYCRHENTAADMVQVVDLWHEFIAGENPYEDESRGHVIELAREIVALAKDSGEL